MCTPVVIFEKKRNSWKEIEWSFDVIASLFEKVNAYRIGLWGGWLGCRLRLWFFWQEVNLRDTKGWGNLFGIFFFFALIDWFVPLSIDKGIVLVDKLRYDSFGRYCGENINRKNVLIFMREVVEIFYIFNRGIKMMWVPILCSRPWNQSFKGIVKHNILIFNSLSWRITIGRTFATNIKFLIHIIVIILWINITRLLHTKYRD